MEARIDGARGSHLSVVRISSSINASMRNFERMPRQAKRGWEPSRLVAGVVRLVADLPSARVSLRRSV